MKLEKLFIKPVYKILCLFFTNPTKEFYEKEVSDIIKISVGAVNKYMKILTKIELLQQEKHGRMHFYTLNRENLLVKYLKVVFTLSTPLIQEIKDIKNGSIRIFLYGSYARGEDTEESDIDMLLISKKEDRNKVIGATSNLGRKYGKEIKISACSQEEWLAMREDDPAFYERVEKDKIELI